MYLSSNEVPVILRIDVDGAEELRKVSDYIIFGVLGTDVALAQLVQCPRSARSIYQHGSQNFMYGSAGNRDL